MTLIIYCHPSKKSHNYKILQNVIQRLEKRKQKYEVLDLYDLKFDGYFKEVEYDRMRNRDRTLEKDVLEIQKKITEARVLVFIYPTWWYNMPARLKGFFDRVFTNGFAYKFFKANKFMIFGANLLSFIPGIRYLMQTISVTPLLKGKRAYIFRTYGGPKLGRRIFGNTQTVLENVILRFCGITDIIIHELYNIDKSEFTQMKEEKYMKKIDQMFG
ncbi:MAG: NAD(P)H-dependent oxidoreductase [Candidatus Altimarinota bacterium]